MGIKWDVVEEKEPSLTIVPEKWSGVPLPTRLYYLEACRNNLRRVAPYWVEEEASLRGHSHLSEEGAESWLLGPIPLARTIRYLINGVKSGGRPTVPSRRLRIDGRSVSRVFPSGIHEGLLYWDVEAHVWSIGSQHQGFLYRRARDTSPGAALVLGASNVSSICAVDLLSKLFCENRPVVCMVPPRLQPLIPIFREIFHPLIRDRHLQILGGGPETGERLVESPLFETVHLTGAKKTFDAIQKKNPFPKRVLTAELGCVTPALIVPGLWSQKELQYQARHLVSLLLMNGGYNCVTPQILVLSKNWSHKNAFLRALKTELEQNDLRDDLFFGSEARRKSFRDSYPDGERFGPRTLVKLDPDKPTRLFEEEAFCGVLGWVELEAEHPERFLKQATRFCNEQLWGDLSCLLLIDQGTRRVYERAVAQSLALLEYGTVGLNVFPGLAFASGVTPWGSYLNGKADTGQGWVHNTFFFDRPEKTVMEGSFMPPTPRPWVKPFPNLAKVGPALFELDLEPSTARLIKFFKAYGSTLANSWRRGSHR